MQMKIASSLAVEKNSEKGGSSEYFLKSGAEGLKLSICSCVTQTITLNAF